MNILFILNDAPYGSERTYNALRLAMALQKDQPGTEVRIFLMADAVTAALTAQGTPQGNYNIERMLKSVMAKGGHVKLCGTCCEARWRHICFRILVNGAGSCPGTSQPWPGTGRISANRMQQAVTFVASPLG